MSTQHIRARPRDLADWCRTRLGVRDRGDVPGWVMVTVMTAILVVAIIGVFEPQIKSAITNAISSVTDSGGGQ